MAGPDLELGAQRDPAGQITRQRRQVHEAVPGAALGGQCDQHRIALAQAARHLGEGQRQLFAQQRQVALALQGLQRIGLFGAEDQLHAWGLCGMPVRVISGDLA